MQDQRNLIVAIVLSVAILVAFQVLMPTEPRPVDQSGTEQTATMDAPDDDMVGLDVGPATDTAGDAAAGAPSLSRETAIEDSPRIRINTSRLHGSIALQGSRIDDLTLIDYRETLDPESPEIVLLSPRQSRNPYYADFGWASADADLSLPDSNTVWQSDTTELGDDEVAVLTWDNGAGLLFERTISIDENYMFTVTQRVTNTSQDLLRLSPYGRVLRFGTPPTLGFFILHEGPYGVFDGTLEEYDYDDVQDAGRIEYQTTGGWLGFTDKYWLVALVPDQTEPLDARFDHVLSGSVDRYFATYQAQAYEVAPGESVEVTNRLFAGAKEVAIIDAYEENLGITQFDLTIDFGWFYFLTKPFFYALAFINGLVGNFGVAILLFTVCIKALFFPLANKSYRSMSKMKALQPELLKIRERYQDDRQQMNMEMMSLYKREKVNPASGCLPILVQIPVFFALYKVLFVTIEMRHEPFFGWIQDLSVMDPTTIFNLFGLIPWTPPDILMVGIWPLLMGISMYLQQKLNPAPADPMQQKIFMMLPILFTFLLARFPAGLVIYWTWNNVLSIIQQYVIMRRMGVKIGGGVVAQPHAPPSVQRKHGHDDEEAAPASAANPGDDSAAGSTGDDASGAESERPRASRSASGAGGSAASRRRAAQAARKTQSGSTGGGPGKRQGRGRGQRKPRA